MLRYFETGRTIPEGCLKKAFGVFVLDDQPGTEWKDEFITYWLDLSVTSIFVAAYHTLGGWAHSVIRQVTYVEKPVKTFKGLFVRNVINHKVFCLKPNEEPFPKEQWSINQRATNLKHLKKIKRQYEGKTYILHIIIMWNVLLIRVMEAHSHKKIG